MGIANESAPNTGVLQGIVGNMAKEGLTGVGKAKVTALAEVDAFFAFVADAKGEKTPLLVFRTRTNERAYFVCPTVLAADAAVAAEMDRRLPAPPPPTPKPGERPVVPTAEDKRRAGAREKAIQANREAFAKVGRSYNDNIQKDAPIIPSMGMLPPPPMAQLPASDKPVFGGIDDDTGADQE